MDHRPQPEREVRRYVVSAALLVASCALLAGGISAGVVVHLTTPKES